MDLARARAIHRHMVAWYMHATLGTPEETPPALTYTLAEMVEAAAMIRSGPTEPGKIHVTIDDRAVAALYVIHRFEHAANDADADPILKFPSPDGRAIRALLFLEFRTAKPSAVHTPHHD